MNNRYKTPEDRRAAERREFWKDLVGCVIMAAAILFLLVSC